MIPKKSLGQNFMRCRWVADTMIRAAEITDRDTVLEIGPGTGALTRPLARAAKNVIAIEKDEALARALRRALDTEKVRNVKIIEGDILRFPKTSFEHIKFKVVSNIPYYLTSRLFRYFLESAPMPETIVCTVQKEVADRMCARPPAMNLLALSIRAYGRPGKIKNVPRECFSPKPDVQSAIIRVSDISNEVFKKSGVAPKDFFSLAREAFSKKRKMISSSLKKRVPPEVFESAGVKKTSRPQELEIEEWARLCRAAPRSMQRL